MAKTDPFSPIVAARTRAAQTVLSKRDLLKAYEDAGGLREDLESIAENGLLAEGANRGQSEAGANGMAATIDVLYSFDGLRSEYVAIMNVVQAVHGDLRRAKAPTGTIVAVERILENETRTRIGPTVAGVGAKRKAARVRSQEAIRAEIQKDAGALLALKPVHAALARRKVDVSRLKKLDVAAAALSGKLGERSVKKGAAKTATAVEHEAVRAQKDVWASVYRLLSAVAAHDAGMQQLLAAAIRPRK